MNTKFRYIRFFKDLTIEDVPLVGGKNASLGEMYRELAPQGVKVPNGFAITAEAYRHMLDEAGAWESLHEALDDLDPADVADLARRAARALRLCTNRGFPVEPAGRGGTVLARKHFFSEP